MVTETVGVRIEKREPRWALLSGIVERLGREKGKSLLLAGCLLLLGYLVLYPFGSMLLRGVFDPKTGELTLANFARLLVDPNFFGALVNTLLISGGSLAGALFMALPLAWGVSRTDMPGKGFVRVMTVFTFATPSFLGAIAWVILLGPRGGTLNSAIEDVFGLASAPFNIFGLGGIIFVFSLYLYPYIFFAVCSALDKMDPAMEEAASMLGAGTARTTFTVTLPLVLPAILAGGALVVLESVVNFGVPAIIGMPVHVESLTTRIYRTFQFPPEYHMAAVTAVPIVMIVAACVVIQWLALGRRTFVTVGGASSQPRIVELGRLRYAMTGFALLVMTGSIFLPCGALLVTSLKQTFGFPFGLDNLTMGHFADVWLASTTRRAVYNSVLLASGAALVCMGLALVLAWLVERTTLPGRSAVTALVMACFSFPGIALAVALIFAFSAPPVDIYGTMWILLLAYSIHGLPIVFNYARIGLKQVHIELTDAAEILGASWRRAFWQITVPLIRGGLVAGGLIVFVLMLREFGSSVLLSAAGTEVIAVTIYEFAEEGDNGRMAALAVSVYIVNLLVVLGARGLTQGKS